LKLPPEQEAIKAKCFHPTGSFVEFPTEDVEKSIPERFEKIVRMYPDRVAVKTLDLAITYEQLNKTANRIAHAINFHLGASQQLIALFFDPGIKVVAAILGALKAGRCYVPMDPAFPASRISSMLEDSQANLIVTDTENGGIVAKATGSGVGVLNVDGVPPGLCEENLKTPLSPHTPSFIIYTSGSTGRPKGVLHTHRTALHATMTLTNLGHVCAEDRIALPLSHSFSASIRQLFGALLNGGMLLPFNTKKEGIALLVDWLDKQAVTLCGFTGSMFRHFLFQLVDAKRAYPSLRLCFVGSEAISKNDVDLYKRCLPDHTVIATNMGINETGSIANLLVDKSTEISGSIVPAGYSAEDKEIVLLSDAGTKVGFDTAGEIAVKSEYLSPGYWRQPEMTATKFIADDSNGTKRIYLTGDLGRRSTDGCLYYLGRKDLTVKIRGYAVDTPKVEMALLEHPGVKHAAVVSRQNVEGDTKLVAYIVPTSQSRPSNDQLRRLLKEKLPDYMIPSIYVELDQLPTTPTGKIDRKALPEPSHTRPLLDVSYVSFRSETEKQLVRIWEDGLNVRPIGIHDNFFDLGGHSLNATRIVSRVFQHFRLKIPLQTLFQSPTVAEMATVIAEHQGEQLDNEQLKNILLELESLSDEEAERIVSEYHSKDCKK
jgi:amino acid adenylation domain-containing protein